MLKWLRIQEGWSTVLLLGGVLLSVVWAIQRADWADNLGILTLIALAGLALGVLLGKWQRLPALIAYAVAFVVGGVLIVHQLDPLLPLPKAGHGWLPAYEFLRERGRVWIASAGTDQYADDFYLFLLGLAAVVFLMAYNTAWMIFRLRWIWPALLLPAIVLLLNLGYAPTSLSSYLLLFLLCAILLVARFHIAAREEEWQRGGLAYPESLGWRVLWISLVVATLTIGFGWLAPFSARGALLQTTWSQINGPWQTMESRFNQTFGSLRGPGARPVGNYASFGDRFRLGGPLKLSQNPILVLQADRPYYLKIRTFDSFDGHQWASNVASTFNPVSNGDNYVPQIDLRAGNDLAVRAPNATDQRELTVRMLAPRGSGIFITEQFVKSTNDTYVQLSWTQYRNQPFDLATARREDLPPDLGRVYDLLKDATGLRNTDELGNPLPLPTPTPLPTPSPPPPSRGADATPVTKTPLATSTPRVLPTPTMTAQERAIADELALLGARQLQVRPVVHDGRAVRIIVNGQAANYGDVEVVLPREALQRDSQYKATVLVSNATAPQLRDAGVDYPEWVKQRYLQLPGSTTERTRELAAGLGSGKNAYDAAITIQNYLRDNIKYNENIAFPPPDRNVVDYLLFDSRQGYCEYYSTAMVIMLRTLGIPAREAIGLFSGTYDNDQGGYLYRESNAHAWPEVYFPGYGWIPFEPTAPRSPFEREVGDAGGQVAPGAPAGNVVTSGLDETLPTDAGFPDDPRFGASGRPVQQQHPVWRVLRVAVPLAVLVWGIAALLWLRGLRGLSPTSQFYARLTRSGTLAGVRPPPGTTPYEYARAVSTAVPGTRRSLDQITNLYVREQYGGQQPSIQDVRLVQRAWHTFRAALLRSFLRLRRGGSDLFDD